MEWEPMVRSYFLDMEVSKQEKGRKDDEDIDIYEKRQTLQWQALSAVGKSHNIVKFIRVGPQRWAIFLSQELRKDPAFMVQADNDTCWTSTWNMIDSLLQQQRDRVDVYVSMVSERWRKMNYLNRIVTICRRVLNC